MNRPVIDVTPDGSGTYGTPSEVDLRLARLRRLAWVLDNSIPLPNGWRIGLDPLLGLIPGVGDFVSGAASFYILYEGARMGLPGRVLFRMLGNVGIELLIGAIPVAGDLFDFVWKANAMNLALVEKHYDPLANPRSGRRLAGAIAVAGVVVLILIVTCGVLLAKWIWSLFQ